MTRAGASRSTRPAVVVSVAATLDYEAASSHAITVRATSQDGSTTTQAYTITLSDVNEGGVGAISDGNATADSVAENAALGSAIGLTATAADPDGTDAVSYSLDDDAGGRFAIDAGTGIVTVAGAIDRESVGASLTLVVRATSTDSSFQTRSFTVSIGDVDEFSVTPPVDSNAAADSVAENAANGTLVGITANAADGDATNSGVSYSLTDDAGGRFAIDANTGVASVADGSLLDREAAASHTITVRATSQDGSTADTVFTIGLGDIDEFNVTATDRQQRQHQHRGRECCQRHARRHHGNAADADATTSAVSYTLTDNAGGRFAIDASTGVVSVADGSLLNREAAASHAITVRATSQDGSFTDQLFSIAITDVDEFDVTPPVDSNAAADSVAENDANGTLVGITAGAVDGDATNSGVSYMLTDDAGGRFAIDANTGVVSVADGSLLDREAAASHAITIRATSQDGSVADTVFTIALTDVDEFNVTTPGDSNAATDSVAEDAANGTLGRPHRRCGRRRCHDQRRELLAARQRRRALRHPCAARASITVANGTLLDYESATSHTVTVRGDQCSRRIESTRQGLHHQPEPMSDEFNVGADRPTPTRPPTTVTENAANGALVGITASASGCGRAPQNTISYSFERRCRRPFRRSTPSTGVVSGRRWHALESRTGQRLPMASRCSPPAQDGSTSSESLHHQRSTDVG